MPVHQSIFLFDRGHPTIHVACSFLLLIFQSCCHLVFKLSSSSGVLRIMVDRDKMFLGHLFERSACSPGMTYYTCSSNGFNGCCTASNVCDLPGCPDDAPNAPTVTITLSTEGVAPKTTVISPTTTPAQATALANADAAASSTSKATPTPVSNSSDHNGSSTPIIAGVVCSIVGLAILSVLAWFFLRRRQQKKKQQDFNPNTAFEKEYDLRRQSNDDDQTRSGEALGLFSGYQKPPLTGTATVFSSRRDSSADVASRYEEDEPLSPRDEKTGLEPPPDDEHPAYHALPGQTPGYPNFSPYLPSPITPTTPTTPITPIHSPQQKQHPAYHLHNLSQHPAFRSARSPPQPLKTLRRKPSNLQHEVTPPPEGFSFFSKIRNSRGKPSRTELPAEVPPAASPPRREDSLLPRYNSRDNQQSFRPGHHDIQRDNSANTGASAYSIPIGLGVDTPTSPGIETLVTATASRQPMQRFGKSKLVESSSARTPTPARAPSPARVPSPARAPSPSPPSTPEIMPPTPEITPPTPEPEPEPPRLSAKINFREDHISLTAPPIDATREDHVLSWASYSAGNLSGIGPSNSNGSERARKQRQREIELGIAPRSKSEAKMHAELQGDEPVGEHGTPAMNIEHEILRWSELGPPPQLGVGAGTWNWNASQSAGERAPETPLSQVYRESWVEREDWALR